MHKLQTRNPNSKILDLPLTCESSKKLKVSDNDFASDDIPQLSVIIKSNVRLTFVSSHVQ